MIQTAPTMTPTLAPATVPTPAPNLPDFLSAADCTDVMHRLVGLTRGGGDTFLNLDSAWTGNVRWARNRISSGGDVRSNGIDIKRSIRGALAYVALNTTDDATLERSVRRAEHNLLLSPEALGSEIVDDYQEPYAHPTIWFDTTYHLDAAHRADVVRTVIEPIERAGMLCAGYLEVKATGRSVQSTRSVRKPLYYPWTSAQFSITVRDPQGTGSGWAGVNWNDWSRIDASKLAQVALDKCLRSRNPVRLEPGRYTVILEPQALYDITMPLFDRFPSIDRWIAEGGGGPFGGGEQGMTKIGQRLIDERITITTDPADPGLGYPPFNSSGSVFNPAVWFERGVLKNLAYWREYAIQKLRLNSGLPNSGAFSMSGGTTSIDDMIQTTKRGLIVTRFSGVDVINDASVLCTGYTRDGLWLIENGKISKPVKNFRFTESPLFVLNQVEQLGVPQRIFSSDEAPAMVPTIKSRDFSFTSLADAV